jgi:hypothetical protein
VLYGAVLAEKNIELLLNCTCQEAQMSAPDRIGAVVGWQLTTYTRHRVEAAFFADCSGDSILSFLTPAAFRQGREAASEFHESIAPETADRCTMGLSCLLQARQTDRSSAFIPPQWADSFPDERRFAYREHNLADPTFNFWWLELGGTEDSIADAERIRERLLPLSFGTWDHIKNRGEHGADNWELAWAGFLPGKRESRRYVGAYTLTQNDVRAAGRFADTVAYGGWTMDDHEPRGFDCPGAPNIFHPAPSPFGIPLRCLYSANVKNLGFAGRNISATHAAMSASRVMNTCALLGQALGTAAALAVSLQAGAFADLYPARVAALQQMLLEDDCWLPGKKRALPDLCLRARLENGAEALRDGIDRDLPEEPHGCTVPLCSAVRYLWEKPARVETLRLVFDSDFARKTVHPNPVMGWYPMLCNIPYHMADFHTPETMTRDYRLEYRDAGGNWRCLAEKQDNHQRVNRIGVGAEATGLAFVPLRTWGEKACHLFAFDFMG